MKRIDTETIINALLIIGSAAISISLIAAAMIIHFLLGVMVFGIILVVVAVALNKITLGGKS